MAELEISEHTILDFQRAKRRGLERCNLEECECICACGVSLEDVANLTLLSKLCALCPRLKIVLLIGSRISFAALSILLESGNNTFNIMIDEKPWILWMKVDKEREAEGRICPAQITSMSYLVFGNLSALSLYAATTDLLRKALVERHKYLHYSSSDEEDLSE